MTVEVAKTLNVGDYVVCNNNKYKVLHTKEQRSAATSEIYISIKCGNGNHTVWISNELAERVDKNED